MIHGRVAAGDGQLALDARQGDVRDGVVQDEHELRRGDDEEGQAEAVAARGSPGLACIG